MILDEDIALGFDDVTLVPQFSEVVTRAQISTAASLVNSSISMTLPFVSAPMDTVTEILLAKTLASLGGLAIIHRYCDIEKQCAMFKQASDEWLKFPKQNPIGVAVGATGDYLERTQELYNAGARLLCVDVAHGHHTHVMQALRAISSKFPDVHIMAGNIATAEAFDDLSSWGAHSIRVGVSNGATCNTRIQTGHGLPSLATILDIVKYKKTPSSVTQIILDGGVKKAGDIAKAIAAGADLVMMGSLFAGTDESPGKIIDGKKVFRGMASKDAQIEWRGYHASDEGVATLIPLKGPLKDVVSELHNGLRSGMSYSGSYNLSEFRKKAKFRRITAAGQIEGTPHILRG